MLATSRWPFAEEEMQVQLAVGASLLVVHATPPLVEMKMGWLPNKTMPIRLASAEQAMCRAGNVGLGAGDEAQFVPESFEIQTTGVLATIILLPFAETAVAPVKAFECHVAP
ncbi:MAG: hypothetical protein JWM68_1161 [Verrucomicrobiales bacterium]|nr:hypothetical protein [Verrucomicrobiales bacterium]